MDRARTQDVGRGPVLVISHCLQEGDGSGLSLISLVVAHQRDHTLVLHLCEVGPLPPVASVEWV